MSKRSEKLYDGITNIREELVEQAERKKKPAWNRWGLRAAAAVLALVFVLGVLLNPAGGGGTVASAYAIAEAEYPKAADVQNPPKGYAAGLESYFASGNFCPVRKPQTRSILPSMSIWPLPCWRR